MQYEFYFAQERAPSATLAKLHIPSGTPLPIWIWSLTIVAKEGNRSGIIADLQLIIDNLGHPIHDDEVMLTMVTLFEPKNLRDALLEAKEVEKCFSKHLLDVYLARLNFPFKKNECKDIKFASYLLCRDHKEQERRLVEKRRSFSRDSIIFANLLLYAAAEGMKERIGQSLFR